MKKILTDSSIFDKDGKQIVCSASFFFWLEKQLSTDEVDLLFELDFENPVIVEYINDCKLKKF